MIEQVLEQEKAVSQFQIKKTGNLIPTWQDVDVWESVTKTVDHLMEFKDALCGEEYVNVSYLKPVLDLLKKITVLPHSFP